MIPKLITTIDQVLEIIPVNMTSKFNVIAPFLINAENTYVARLIGAEQFAALIAGDASDEVKAAIPYCRKVIANLGYYQAIPVLAVSVGTSGIQVISTDSTKQAFQWQVEDLKNSLQELGFAGIEELLGFLEENLATFTPYANSDQRKAQLECLITSALDFNGFYDIGGSRFVFQTISYIMRRVEQQQLNKLFGTDFFKSLKAADLSEKKQILVNEYLKPGIALLTVAKAATERIITLKNGQVTYNFRGRTDNMQESQALNNKQIDDATAQLVADGSTYLQDGLQYIVDNLADFNDFTPPVARRRFKATNDPCKGIFMI